MDNLDPVYHQYLNPDYGHGIFRRRIRLVGSGAKVCAELEDTNHGFRSTVFHDGNKVTDIHAEALRAPLSTCGGAIEPLKQLIGTTLDASTKDITTRIDPRANCTHLYDLTLLAIAHCLRGEVTRQYDMEVEDQPSATPAESRCYRDHQLMLVWQARDWQISAGPHSGKPLFKGFAAWAAGAFSGDEQEAAFALQKAYFVSQARRFNVDDLAGTSADDQPHMNGVCFSYSSPNIERAVRTANSTRDFSDCPEQLLTFQ
jgi:hypothetical protein